MIDYSPANQPHSDVSCADTVAMDLLVYPKAFNIHTCPCMDKHNTRVNTRVACTRVYWGEKNNSWPRLAKGSVIKPSAAGKLEVHMLGPAVAQRYEERSARWN